MSRPALQVWGLIVAVQAVAFVVSTASAEDARRSTTPSAGSGAESIDLSASRIYVFVPKAGLGHDHAIEGKLKSGVVRLGAVKDAGELVFDLTSFDADTAGARRYIGLGGTTDAGTRREVTGNMLGPAVLAVQRFPTATFSIASAVKAAQPGRRGDAYTLTGQFTLHGVTRPLTIVAESEQKDGKTRLHGSFGLVQTEFGITPFSKAFGAVGVADRLTVYGDLTLSGK